MPRRWGRWVDSCYFNYSSTLIKFESLVHNLSVTVYESMVRMNGLDGDATFVAKFGVYIWCDLQSPPRRGARRASCLTSYHFPPYTMQFSILNKFIVKIVTASGECIFTSRTMPNNSIVFMQTSRVLQLYSNSNKNCKSILKILMCLDITL